jgi:hypothetical protein
MKRAQKFFYASLTGLLLFWFIIITTQKPLIYGQFCEALWALVLILLSALFIGLYLRGPVSKPLFAFLSVVILLVDLWSFGMRYIQNVPRETVQSCFDIYRTMPVSPVPYRICTNTAPQIPQSLSKWNIMPRYENIQGHNSMALSDLVTYLFYNEARRLPGGEYIDRLRIPCYEMLIQSYQTPMISLLNTRYYFLYNKEAGKIVIEENRQCIDRYLLVDSYQVEPEREKILQVLSSPEYNPRRGILLEEKPGEKDIETTKRLTGKSGKGNEVTISSYGPDRIILSVHAEKACFLLCSEIFYPGWMATIDGEPVKIFKANYTFRALLVPPGQHRIVMWYDPVSFKSGSLLTLSFLGILLIGGVYQITRVMKRQPAIPPQVVRSGD